MSETVIDPSAPAEAIDVVPPTGRTIVPRYIAAALDNMIAVVLAIVAAKSVTSYHPLLQPIALVGVYLGYYFAFEGAYARTPGKLLTGLAVVNIRGEKCSLYQATIRTLFRLLEVNPLLLGALPAAISVVVSKHHQRFGDRVAKTFVVDRRFLSQ